MGDPNQVPYRIKSKNKPSKKQLTSLKKARTARHNCSSHNEDKENQSPGTKATPTPQVTPKKPKAQYSKLESIKRQNRRLKAKNKSLESKVHQLKTQLKAKEKRCKTLERQLQLQDKDFCMKRKKLLEEIAEGKRLTYLYSCTRKSVGRLMGLVSKTFGIKLGRMSRRMVSRAILERGVASKIQIAHELLTTDVLGATISQDSTSHRRQTFEAEHLAVKATNYAGDSNLKPRVRFFCLAAPNDHTSSGSINTWKENIDEMADLYNQSPLAQRLNRQFSVRDFLHVLKGMNGDHVNNEKATSEGLRQWKKEELVTELGEKKLASMGFSDLVLYLASWNLKKIEGVGGHEAWEALSLQEKAERDAALMKEVLTDVGQEAYDALPDEERCCMHKDQNSFKGGNAEMMAEWARIGVDPPVLLANKANTTILHHIFEPGKNLDRLLEVERKAFEESTRGGVKAMDLAGALFNNKDDKKGQGDIHVNHFKQLFGKNHRRFPDTSNTRFGSHGFAACEVIKHLDAYINKTNPSRTNIELNLLRALEDKATITELCAMVLYTNAICYPYMRIVRGPGTEEVNVLSLGPLHAENPDLLLGDTASSATTSLDGKEWEDKEAVDAVFKLAPTLLYLTEITLAFFWGALTTWIRFSAEFAPGGLIDEATADKRHLAWMPSTNDANEGRLGHYRVTLRGKPTLTLHQYNAEAMYSRNNTLAFMEALFENKDHQYIMQEARRIDASGLEAKQRTAQVEFRRRVVEMNKEKEEAKKKKAVELREKLKKIPLIRELTELETIPRPELDPKGSRKWTGHVLDLQLDALRFRKVTIPMKSKLTKVEDKREALKKGFKLYLKKLNEMGREWPNSLGNDEILAEELRIEEEWHEQEDVEMEE
ncbi:hypothetical protein K435DRAFT_808933 [Dendrothele bispora CBS 962.96]|uniref:Uncharacterized protein n=1 Tax=Dendrothele bispora (strain CBS 962.96) TaxID=1314807 RepID=A0A4S8KZV2_DENBC|nr:hypothetical protein K435DRAFT_808933 [Dendrothele bispora CBS 962.96]